MDLVKLLPTVLPAGEDAGILTVEGAKRLDPTGTLQPGIPFCPPEGDAGTGMVATNSVAPRTGNVSAGTSIFAMVVLEKPLSKVYPEIDMVTTPDGAAVAMVHCNNCTSDLNAWVDLLAESAALCGANIDKGALFTLLFNESLHGAPDCGGITPVNYISGESVTHLDAGVPLLLRRPDSAFTLANFMRANIYSSFATLAMGLEILRKENVAVNTLLGHGGIFKTPGVAQRYLAAAAGAPVTCMETAGEGGAGGIAVLAAFLAKKKDGQSQEDYLAALRALGEQELAKHTRIENFRFTPTGTVTVGKVVAASLPGTDIQAAARITSVTLSSQKGENTVTTEIGTPILRRKP